MLLFFSLGSCEGGPFVDAPKGLVVVVVPLGAAVASLEAGAVVVVGGKREEVPDVVVAVVLDAGTEIAGAAVVAGVWDAVGAGCPNVAAGLVVAAAAANNPEDGAEVAGAGNCIDAAKVPNGLGGSVVPDGLDDEAVKGGALPRRLGAAGAEVVLDWPKRPGVAVAGVGAGCPGADLFPNRRDGAAGVVWPVPNILGAPEPS
jgi:hypothetical protein